MVWLSMICVGLHCWLLCSVGVFIKWGFVCLRFGVVVLFVLGVC